MWKCLKYFFARYLFISLFFEKFRCRFQVLCLCQVLSCRKEFWLIANQAKYLWIKVHATHGLLCPVLQVGVNPHGTKTSCSLPSRRDPSTALGTPRCRGSPALGVHTRSALSSRTTCSPTVCTGILLGKRSAWSPLGAGLDFLPSLREGEVMGDTWVIGGSGLPLPAALVSHVQDTLWHQSKSKWLFPLGILSHSPLGLGLLIFNCYFHGIDWKEK